MLKMILSNLNGFADLKEQHVYMKCRGEFHYIVLSQRFCEFRDDFANFVTAYNIERNPLVYSVFCKFLLVLSVLRVFVWRRNSVESPIRNVAYHSDLEMK